MEFCSLDLCNSDTPSSRENNQRAIIVFFAKVRKFVFLTAAYASCVDYMKNPISDA